MLIVVWRVALIFIYFKRGMFANAKIRVTRSGLLPSVGKRAMFPLKLAIHLYLLFPYFYVKLFIMGNAYF